MNQEDMSKLMATAKAIALANAASMEEVNHPAHYTSSPSGVEAIEVLEHMNFNRGNAMKYIWRAGHKGNLLQDLEKAKWYLEREIKRLTVALPTGIEREPVITSVQIPRKPFPKEEHSTYPAAPPRLGSENPALRPIRREEVSEPRLYEGQLIRFNDWQYKIISIGKGNVDDPLLPNITISARAVTHANPA